MEYLDEVNMCIEVFESENQTDLERSVARKIIRKIGAIADSTLIRKLGPNFKPPFKGLQTGGQLNES